MKKYIYMSLMMALLCVLSLSFTACDDDDDKLPAPEITINEANIEDDVLCVQADVVAKGRTASILLTITGQNGTVKASQAVTDSKYIGVLNIDGFHVHMDIADKNVEEGDILEMSVTDGQGLTTTSKKSITEEEDDDDE
ncbi:hypothetical protein [Prevotella sp. lc2012]|uniref:hypothetical protein n=1 Tax=Prevotella sp. lc2012 TaxID=1761886 RepID=UPI00089B4A96|nr:hypothetical protein [Prevotella sp. lc2012]SEE02257.1 hypothetical protein SAMN04487828_0215 [Prevotella sp. lc2012]